MRSWVIGNSTECDVVVDSALASARHCQLTKFHDGFLLEDLGSTNGTYVNGVRIAGSTYLTRGDAITLGRTVPFPWPPELATLIQIGRLANNDVVLDDARVSGHHARLIVAPGFQTLIEDIGSSNGTFLNSTDRRVTGPTPISESDTLFFGTLAVPASRLLRATGEPQTPASTQSLAVDVGEQRHKPVPTPPTLAFQNQNLWLLACLVQAPVFAVVIVLVSGRRPAATTFALALAAIWLGGSLAIVESAIRRSPSRNAHIDALTFLVSFGQRLAVLSVLCSVGSAVLMAIVAWGSGLNGPWGAMWFVIVMTSLVGLFLGLAVAAPVVNWAASAAILLVSFVVMTALGGYIQPLPNMDSPVKLAASAMPSRWAFEGLLLLETADHQAPVTGKETEKAQNHDQAERFFPAHSERMGPTADVMALGSMLIGLAALAAFISGLSRLDPKPLSNA